MTAKSSRTGFALIAVLVLISMATLLMTGWVRQTLSEHRQSRRLHQHAQAEWLAASALDHAVLQWQRNPEFKELRWQLSPQELAQPYAAEVAVKVTQHPTGNRLTVTVDLPPGPQRQVRHTHSLLIPSTPQGESS